MGCGGSKEWLMISDEESVVDFLAQNTFFKDLGGVQIENAARKFTIKKFSAGQRVVTQGETSDSLFCVALGAVNFIAIADDNSEKIIRRMGRHDFFGEFGLIHSTPRSVSVDAVTDVVLLSLERVEFDRSKSENCMKNLQRWVDATASSIVSSGLKEIDFLSNVSDDQLALIGRLFKCKVVPAGTVIVQEGTMGDRFYILSRGSLVVTTRDEFGLYVELTRLHPGATFGELALIKDQPRNATITTLEESVLFSLGREEFRLFMKLLPVLGEQIQRSVNDHATVTKIAEKISVFNSMNRRKQHLLAEVCVMSKFIRNTTILEEGGMEPRRFFIITRGNVDIFIGDNKVRTIGVGSYFGEVGLVSDSPHSATVRVSPDADAYMLSCSQDDFESLFVGEPTVLAEISLRVLGSRATLEDVLRHPLGCEYFGKHIEKEFAKENIDFWSAVEKLESIGRRRVRKSVLGALNVTTDTVTDKKKEMLQQEALGIYEQYISPDSNYQVNLPGPIVSKITDKVKENKYNFKMFSDAKQEVFALMSKDSFSRFQDSKEYKSLLNKLGVYEQKQESCDVMKK